VYTSSPEVVRSRLNISTLRDSFPSELLAQMTGAKVDGELLSALWRIER